MDESVVANACQHDGAKVEFDIVEAQKLDAHAIRQRFPRFNGKCPDCGCDLIKYASMEHYYYGDW